MSTFRMAVLRVFLLCWSCAACAAATSHQNQIQTWLSTHPKYRLATEADCQCAEDIASLRKGAGDAYPPQPNYEPYYATGDFDGDGIEDAAYIVLSQSSNTGVSVVVLFGNGANPSEFIRQKDNVKGTGLFVHKPTTGQKRWILEIGAFESEAEEINIPAKH